MSDSIKKTDIIEEGILLNIIKESKELLPIIEQNNTALSNMALNFEKLSSAENKTLAGLLKTIKAFEDSEKLVDKKNKLEEEAIKLKERLKAAEDKLAETRKKNDEKEVERKKKEEEKLSKLAQKSFEDYEKILKKQQAEQLKAAKASEKIRLQQEKESTETFKLSQQINKLTKEYIEVSLAKGRDSEESKKLLEQLTPLRLKQEQLRKDTGRFQDAVGRYPNSFDKATTAIKNFSFQLFSVLGITAGLTGLIRLFSGLKQTIEEFDTGMIGVVKTTGLAGKELENFKKQIIGLSQELKTVSTDKLLEYATVAGQLGVKGSKNILLFSESLAKLEIASNISGEEGAADIARLLTLVDGGVQNVGNFSDEIVKLGNNFAATEKEILSNATQIAQNTGVYKLGRQYVLAYATATKAVGIEAELTGSTIGRTFGIFEKAIRTGENLEAITRLTGKSQEELKKQFKENSGQVLNDFITGLNKVSVSGGSVNEQLELIGINSIRDQRVIGSLATAGFGTLEKALIDVQKATGSLNTEFEAASISIANSSKKASIAYNNFVLSLDSGNGIISKSIRATFDGISSFFESLEKEMIKQELGLSLIREFNLESRAMNEVLIKTSKSLSKFTLEFNGSNKSVEQYDKAIKKMQSRMSGLNLETEEGRILLNIYRRTIKELEEGKKTAIKTTDALAVSENKLGKEVKKTEEEIKKEAEALEKLDKINNLLRDARARNIKDDIDRQKKTERNAFDDRIKQLRTEGLLTEELERELRIELNRKLKELDDKRKEAEEKQWRDLRDARVQNMTGEIEQRKRMEVNAFNDRIEQLKKDGLLTNALEEQLRIEHNRKLLEIEASRTDFTKKEIDKRTVANVKALTVEEANIKSKLERFQEYYKSFSSNVQEAYNNIINMVNKQDDREAEILNQRINRQQQAIQFEQDLAARGMKSNLALEKQNLAQMEAERERFEIKRKRREKRNLLVQTYLKLIETTKPLEAVVKAAAIVQGLTGFAKGTDNAPEGAAMLFEEGSEIWTDKHGKIKEVGSNEGTQIRYLKAGDQVLNNKKTREALKGLEVKNGKVQVPQTTVNSKPMISNIRLSADVDSIGNVIFHLADGVAGKNTSTKMLKTHRI